MRSACEDFLFLPVIDDAWFAVFCTPLQVVVIHVGNIVATKFRLDVLYVLLNGLINAQFARLLQQKLNQLLVDESAHLLAGSIARLEKLHVDFHVHLPVLLGLLKGEFLFVVVQRVSRGRLGQLLYFFHVVELNFVPLCA